MNTDTPIDDVPSNAPIPNHATTTTAGAAGEPITAGWTGAEPARGPTRPPSRRWIAAGAAVVVFGAAAVFGLQAVSGGGESPSTGSQSTNSAPAASPGGSDARGRFGGGTAGTIAAINGSRITLTSVDGQATTVITNASTRVSSTESASVSDIAVGDHVIIMGTTSGSTVAAQRIVDNGSQALEIPGGAGNAPPQGAPAGGGFGGGVTGTVSKVSGSTLTVTAADGTTTTVTTSSSTTVSKTKTTSLSGLTVGDQIRVNGTTASDGTVTATSISAGGMPSGFSPPGAGSGSFPGEPPATNN